MIDDLDETLRQLLREELPIRNGEIEVTFEQPRRENTARWNKPTVNLFLYDVRENNVLRRHQWERVPNGGNGEHQPGGHQAAMKRSPMRVDCLYMLTTWASDPGDEHRLLARCMQALFRFPVLPADRLVGALQHPEYDLRAQLASHERLTNPAEVWSALDNEMRPSVSYVVTLALDPWQAVTGPVVRTLTVRTGQADALPRHWRLGEGTVGEVSYVGGTVRQGSAEGPPAAGVQVAIKGTGHVDTTDAEGRFVLGGLPRGEYTLIAWPPGGRPKERAVRVPAVDASGAPLTDGEYDMEI